MKYRIVYLYGSFVLQYLYPGSDTWINGLSHNTFDEAMQHLSNYFPGAPITIVAEIAQ